MLALAKDKPVLAFVALTQPRTPLAIEEEPKQGGHRSTYVPVSNYWLSEQDDSRQANRDNTGTNGVQGSGCGIHSWIPPVEMRI